MNATTAFEHRREALREQLEAAQDAPQAIAALTMALEQTACELAQDEQDEHARQRQQAVLALAKRAPQLLHAARAEGELRLPSRPEEKAAPRFGKLQLGGALILAALAIAQLADGKLLYAVLQAAGAALLVFGGARAKAQTSRADGARAVGVLRFDASELVRTVSELCGAADVCVGDLALLERDAGRAGAGSAMDEATLDLLISLLEARATGRGDVALKSLDQAEQALRAQSVEVVYYSAQTAGMFDLLPTLGGERTVRPALTKDGRLLRRGVAACRMERGVGV